METAWNIYKQASNVDNHNLHNRKATPQFAMINCAFIVLWYSFPQRLRMIDTTFGKVLRLRSLTQSQQIHRIRCLQYGAHHEYIRPFIFNRVPVRDINIFTIFYPLKSLVLQILLFPPIYITHHQHKILV
jgi:hypothetical protein